MKVVMSRIVAVGMVCGLLGTAVAAQAPSTVGSGRPGGGAAGLTQPVAGPLEPAERLQIPKLPVPDPTPPGPSARFGTLPVGATLPSGAQCASRVQSAPEVRSGNRTANQTRGVAPNGRYPRADGDFVGTTDEILQWVACKWGIDEDIVRAQTAKESWWHQNAGGDLSSDPSNCHPALRGSTPCPESIGVLQVRFGPHLEAFENDDAIRSTAYNADYAYAGWRACFEGDLTWLNHVERRGTYAAGDAKGCLGVWFSGRWHIPSADEYIAAVDDYLQRRIWTTPEFRNG